MSTTPGLGTADQERLAGEPGQWAGRQRKSRGRGLALRAAITVVVLGVLFAIEPGLLRDSVSSPRTFATVLGFVALFIGWSALLRRFVPNTVGRAVLLVLPAVAAAWFLVAPYTRDVVVEEALPGAQADPVVQAPAPAGIPADQPPPAAPAAPAAPAGPVELASGAIAGIDHRATGRAAIYQLEDGSAVLRFEDVDMQNGPDLVVYLVPGVGAEHPTATSIGLGALKGNQGSHNYELPAGTDLSGDFTALVYCRAFSVPFASAAL